MVTFNFKDYGENLGTRPLGRQVRERLLPLLEQNERVVLDFTGVDVVSNSFADECIAKLLLSMSLAELKAHTTFQGLNPVASESILTALQRRHLSMA
ncbi:MAG: STAS-like domain-containing protein [Bacteroidales bacterium]|nr:STAS-like domain-containing protein [Bacteroidales bacterium]